MLLYLFEEPGPVLIAFGFAYSVDEGELSIF